ncbi:YegS/Rv2252/BmrU family lipid kinase [Anoxybacterium hadale]|uniref:YegS/Rv2252/BmrU family lipid kinase n=1 Tax=Anoxybacterium hadale TaxID=3408580 RepID=A0ACD1A9U6_9FIRM|nr:YegS/Rv2252/BmrU family lipid kinase [Clostridiales bacterium]
MKHIFIMNPAAGKGKAGEVFLPRIIEASKKLEIDYEIHRTIAPGDAEHFVRTRCETLAKEIREEESKKEIVRFYACGGDGTLNEVANGAYGYPGVEIAMIPAGTGNDFPRSFGDGPLFEDIEAQIRGTSRSIDLIRYVTTSDEEDNPPFVRYGINMFNIGLDCNVADRVGTIKQYPFVNGSLAYIIGIAIVLGKKEGVKLQLCLEDGELYEGDYILAAIGNGCYCGGGFKALPRAITNDSLMDVIIVDNLTRRTLLSIIGKYRKGTHLDDPSVMNFLTYKQCKSLKMIPNGKVKMCTDGEVSTVGETVFEILPNAMKFSVPQGCY